VLTKLLLVLSALVFCTPAFAGQTIKRGPGNLPPGGDSAMHEMCRQGGKGAGYDTLNSCWVASCGKLPALGMLPLMRPAWHLAK
jgi:hypothetical protein